MRQNPMLPAVYRFDQVDETLSAVIARATARLALASIEKAPQGSGLRIALSGNLGVGKTTWARAFLRACGISGRIKSPSFSVVETYAHAGHVFHHLDFYRQSNPAAWQGGGLRDLLTERAVVLMEWPEHAQGLPRPHIEILMGWQQQADAAAPRTLEIHFVAQGDGIEIAPYLAAWEQAVKQPEPSA